jgi:hypothetical protein
VNRAEQNIEEPEVQTSSAPGERDSSLNGTGGGGAVGAKGAGREIGLHLR